jgi:hypothetical protein
MARPRIVRTKEEAAAVDPSLPVQVEITLPDPVLEMELFLTEKELALAEQLVAAKRRLVVLLRRAVFKELTHGGHRSETVETAPR